LWEEVLDLHLFEDFQTFLGCYQGRFIAFEVKRPGGITTPAQITFLESVRESGGVAAVVYSLEAVQKILEKL
jgi:penicillin-binding protein-related factor A (putative recombinase)